MIDQMKRKSTEEAKERVRKRIRIEVDTDNYEHFPAKKQVDYYDNDVSQRVAIYVRVSTDDVRQTTSFELQKKYYEEYVVRHPNWTLVKIYADEGISGTSLKNRNAFNEMIAEAKAGKLDLIVTKSVSRFSRNAVDCIGIVRDLADLRHPVGVFFESECLFSLNEDNQMTLSLLASVAEEESHTRSRSMETSLRMRLDNGIPLTPKLLGYTHDMDGNLIVNEEEAPTVKLAFYMYLFGYSTQQIADAMNALGRKSYLGNVKWTTTSIVQILRNERHCGDVLTRKTFTPNFRTHLSRKNRGERPQSRYYNHHEPIVSRDDFIAVQRMLDNAKYGNKSILPELRVIDEGIFKGYVIINPRWAGFKEEEYLKAAHSAYSKEDFPIVEEEESEVQIEVDEGDFDLRGFEITRSEFFDSLHRPMVTFSDKKIKFNTECVRKLGEKNSIEMLINPIIPGFAIRTTDSKNRNAVVCSNKINGTFQPRDIGASAFFETLYKLFGWNKEYKYRIIGSLYESEKEVAYMFDVENSEAFFKNYMLPMQPNADGQPDTVKPLSTSGKRIRAIPEHWANSFGKEFYLHERSLQELDMQSEADWQIRMEGQLVETGKKIKVTGFDELRTYIKQELSALTQ